MAGLSMTDDKINGILGFSFVTVVTVGLTVCALLDSAFFSAPITDLLLGIGTWIVFGTYLIHFSIKDLKR